MKYIHVFLRGVYFVLSAALLRKLGVVDDDFGDDALFCDEIFFPLEWG
ncbi:MAG: hypothetical protein IIA77_07925 [Proteobacteria bacterium]|nr:hypothetical protein [Pseudomonadota bacterium]